MSEAYVPYVTPESRAERNWKLAEDKRRQLEVRVSIATAPAEEAQAEFNLKKFLADEYPAAKASLAESQARDAAMSDARVKAKEIMAALDAAKVADPLVAWNERQTHTENLEQQRAQWLEAAKKGETLS